MQIMVKRDDQEHGPYTIEEVTEYLASGNIVGDDVAREDGTTEWKTVDALLLSAQKNIKNESAESTLATDSLAVAGSPLRTTVQKFSKEHPILFLLVLLGLGWYGVTQLWTGISQIADPVAAECKKSINNGDWRREVMQMGEDETMKACIKTTKMIQDVQRKLR